MVFVIPSFAEMFEKVAGLGLNVVYKMVSQYDGYIGYKNNLPQGTRFEIFF
jgi:signal transduction histidine kinase